MIAVTDHLGALGVDGIVVIEKELEHDPIAALRLLSIGVVGPCEHGVLEHGGAALHAVHDETLLISAGGDVDT